MSPFFFTMIWAMALLAVKDSSISRHLISIKNTRTESAYIIFHNEEIYITLVRKYSEVILRMAIFIYYSLYRVEEVTGDGVVLFYLISHLEKGRALCSNLYLL